jgi:nuclear respiratory factor 1
MSHSFSVKINASQGANGHTVHSVHTIGENQNQDGVTVDILNNVPEATLNQEGQIIITGEDGQGNF